MTSSRLLSRHPAAQVAGHNIITVASGKGGVGKTWFAITLAHAFSRAGIRTLLFDGDLGLANVDIQLGLAPPRDLGGVISEEITLKDAVYPYRPGEVHGDQRDGFDIIAGRSGSGTLAALPEPHLTALRSELSALSHDYERTILDLGAGVDAPVRLLAGSSGRCLVVTTEEPTSITDAYAFIKLTLARRADADIQIVVNRAVSAKDGQRTYATLRKACETFLGATPPLAGIIRFDSHVQDSIRRQSPLLTRYPNCFAAQDIEALAQRLLGATD